MVLTAAILPPETLASWGLINRVLPADRLDGEGRAFAQSLASGPTRRHRKPRALRPGIRELQQPLNDIAARRLSRVQGKNQLLGAGLAVCFRMGDRHIDRGSLG
jgi:enoyl-CoA hydratase/carnithine racemase